MRSLERNFSDRGNSKGKALVMGMGLVCLRLRKMASGLYYEQRKEWYDVFEEEAWAYSGTWSEC